MEGWYYRRLIWNGIFIFGSLMLFSKEFCVLVQRIILALLCVCLILALLIDLIPSILKKDKVSSRFYLLPINEKLMYLTKNVDAIIIRLYFIALGIVVLNYFLYDHIPILLSYIYWILFGSYFAIKIVRYSDLYVRKHNDQA